MENSQVRPTVEEQLFFTYSNMLFRLCFTFFGNKADAEDAVSEVFIKYLEKAPEFNDEEHKKAWLLRVASNTCKDMLRSYSRKNNISLYDAYEYCKTEEDTDIITAVLNLPSKYKDVVYIHYIEGYKTAEIAKILHISESAVRKRLQYARNMLKKYLRGELE